MRVADRARKRLWRNRTTTGVLTASLAAAAVAGPLPTKTLTPQPGKSTHKGLALAPDKSVAGHPWRPSAAPVPGVLAPTGTAHPVARSFPAAGVADVDLTGFLPRLTVAQDASDTSDLVRAGGLGIKIGPGDGGAVTDQAAPGDHGSERSTGRAVKVHVAVTEHAAAVAAGINGELLTVTRTDGGTGIAPVKVAVSYADFASAFGGDYATRLHLVSLPSCALTTPEQANCQSVTPVLSVNDAKAQQLLATVALPGDGTPMVLAATATGGGSTSNYQATSLSASTTWSTGGNSGSFTYDYPFTSPASLGGSAPSVSLGYDSGSVDGRTTVENGQASQIGDGWDFSPGFIERSYQPCSKAITGSTASDVCFGKNPTGGQALTLSFGQHGGTLVPVDGDTTNTHFKLPQDDGTTVDLIGGAGNGTVASTAAAGTGEFFRVRTPDGTVYYFGADKLPVEQGGTSSDQPAATQSTWSEPVFNNPATSSCANPATAAPASCMTAWRWNLDFAVDTHNNVTRYMYGREVNFYGHGTAKTPVQYWRGGFLTEIDYGFQTGDVVANRAPAAKVILHNVNRCIDPGTQYAGVAGSGNDHGASAVACSSAIITGTKQAQITNNNEAYFYDTPSDQLCLTSTYGGSANLCSVTTPTFWSSEMLGSVTTQIRSAGVFQPVDHWDLFHQFNPMSDSDALNNRRALWLAAIRHCGGVNDGGACNVADGTSTSPDVLFNPHTLPNRVPGNPDGNLAAVPVFLRQRIGSINTETNGSIGVAYNETPCSAPPTGPADWHNTASCFPEYWTPPNKTSPSTDWFNKYTVDTITVTDGSNSGRNGGANSVFTHYLYDLGGMAWHSNDSEFIADNNYRTYDQYRGFAKITTLTGTGNDPQTETVSTYLRGMDQDPDLAAVKAGVPCSYNSPDCPILKVNDNLGGSTQDDNALAGRSLETQVVNTQTSQVWSDTVTRPWLSAPQADHTRAGNLPHLRSRQLGTAVTVSQVPVVGNGATAAGSRITEADTFHSVSGGGRVFATDTHAPVYSGVAPAKPDTTPEICTFTGYAVSTDRSRVMLGFADTTRVATGGCFTAAVDPFDPAGSIGAAGWNDVNATNLVSYKETRYDDDGTDATDFAGHLTKGEPTISTVVDGFNADGSYRIIKTAGNAFDSYGRLTDANVLNPDGSILQNVHTTYNAPQAGELPTQSGIKNAMGWLVTSDVNLRGQAVDTIDANGRRTDETYDRLGRLVQVWTPDHSKTAFPSTPVKKFSYGVNGNAGVSTSAPNWVETDTLREDNSTYLPQISLYDSLGRIRQTQTVAVDGSPGRTVVDTFYDSLGHTVGTDGPYYEATTAPNHQLWTGTLETQIDREARTVFDGLGHPVRFQTFTEGNVTPMWESTTAYPGADRVDSTPATAAGMTPATGGVRTSTFNDARGLTTALYTYQAGASFGDVGHADITSYGYDAAGRQTQVVDAAGNNWTTSYNLLGQKTASHDPDAGDSLYQKPDGSKGYDPAGNLTDVRNANGEWLHYHYDQLNRKTGEWSGSSETDSALMASWSFDQFAKGQPDSSTRYIGGKNGSTYKTSVTGYDAAYRPLGSTVTIPSAEGALAGTYTTTMGYTPITGLLDHTDLPVGGDLQADTVGYGYNANGLMITSGDNFADLLVDSSYSNYGQVMQRVLGDLPNTVAQNTNYDPATWRVRNVSTTINGWAGPVDNVNYMYNPAGQLTGIQDLQSTAKGWTTMTDPSGQQVQIVAVNTAIDLQCFSYDYAGRLTQAWTDTAGTTLKPGSGAGTGPGDTATGAHLGAVDSCTSNGATPANWKIGGGPAPYGQTFNYGAVGSGNSHMGNRDTEADYAGTGAVTATRQYHYGANGQTTVQPHTLTDVTTTVGSIATDDRYTYDSAGDTTGRSVKTGSPALNETLKWGPEGTLDSSSDANGNTASYVYGADGTELVRHDTIAGKQSATLYLGSTELHLSGGTVTGQRYFAIPGAPTIVENGGGVPKMTYEVGDNQGTSNTTIDAGTAYSLTGISGRRYTTPFNTPRGTSPTNWIDDHTFLGKTSDTSTGLVDIGVRKYDPGIGRFVSVDPVFQAHDPRGMGGFAYAGNDPINSADPTGLTAAGDSANSTCPNGVCTTAAALGYTTTDDDPGHTGDGHHGLHEKDNENRNHRPVIPTCDAHCQIGVIAEVDYTQQDQAAQTMRLAMGDPSLTNAQNAINAYEAGLLGGPGNVTDVLLAIADVATNYRDIEGCKESIDAKCMIAILGDIPAGKLTKFAKLSKAARAAEDGDVVASRAGDLVADVCKTPGVGHSFKGDTQVLMADGSTQGIQYIKVGDEIENAHPGGAQEKHRVDATHVTYTDEDFTDLVVVTRAGSSMITSTQNHPYYDLTAGRFVDAAELHRGDRLQAGDASTVTVETVKNYTSSMVTYDLTIDGLHTYYVLAGDTPVLVHNTQGCGPMVLGIGQHSDALAADLEGGYTFNGPDYAQVVGQSGGKPIAQWQVEVSNVLRNNGKVAISLKGMDGATPAEQFMNAYKAGSGDEWRATEWEMRQVGIQVQMGNLDWGNITFYGNDGVVAIPKPEGW
ncbi:MAG: hypothetical protein HOV67_32685 [Kribbellaceae bacterium]|nr:hypothetical protein [Kribbellaceae bacterium]